MLSKYYVSRQSGTCKFIDEDQLQRDVNEVFSAMRCRRISPRGTLGIFFELENENGEKRFVKTHTQSEDAEKNLIKEFEILTCLYADRMDVQLIQAEKSKNRRSFLIMEWLPVNQEIYTMQDVLKIQKEYNGKLDSEYDSLKSYVNYSWEEICQAAETSIDMLTDVQQINSENRTKYLEVTERLREYGDKANVICHGDLSNMNIIRREKDILVIDWEDALCAVSGYDILYWLTFFINRKYYSKKLLEGLGIDRQYGKDIMIGILLVKSFLSYVNGTYRINSLSTGQRIEEVDNML